MSVLRMVLFTACILTLSSCSQPQKLKDLEKKTAQATIQKFYRGYLKSPREAKELRFSKSYQEIAKLNKKLCSAQKQLKCGFDGDIYLNAQDYAANLTYESSGMSIRQPTEDTVVVTLISSQMTGPITIEKSHTK